MNWNYTSNSQQQKFPPHYSGKHSVDPEAEFDFYPFSYNKFSLQQSPATGIPVRKLDQKISYNDGRKSRYGPRSFRRRRNVQNG